MSDGKAAGYHSSFLNFVEKNPLNKDGDDESDVSQNSDNSSSKQESLKVPTNKPNVAKRGRLRGPKSARSRVSKNYREKSSESDPASGDDKQSDDNKLVVPRRGRPPRASKAKALERTKRLGKSLTVVKLY